jgi:hypothetical protein
MVVAKLNLVVLAVAAGGVLWIEHAQRVRIEISTPAEIAARNASICPENESVPFSVDCMMFIQNGVGSGVDLPANAANGALAESPELP